MLPALLCLHVTTIGLEAAPRKRIGVSNAGRGELETPDGGRSTVETAAQTRFAKLITELRGQRAMSLAALGAATYVSRGWINNVEAGRRWPARSWAEQADVALNSDGVIICAWDAGQEEREHSEGTRSLLVASVKDSQKLIVSNVHERDLDSLQDVVEQLAVAYLASPARPMLTQGVELHQELMSRAKIGAIRPRELADLYLALGRVSGIMAYAALDLGRPDIARQHIDAAWHMAEMAEVDELKAWVRGTQSLVARFDQNWVDATFYIEDGLRHSGAGTSTLRLLSGAAQCAANLGDTERAIEYLDRAERERETAAQDSLEGLFGFSRAKQWYYGGSSLMWLPERHALERAEKNAELAIATWEHEPPAQRSLDDEALAHVYLATARIRLHDLDGAMEAVRPILQLPPERQISWISKRVANLADLLDSKTYSKSPQAAEAREELRAYGA
ncbi:helix-turn-helix domain-containing protein [Crossiella sp. SN42]|uniref:helix-turn-helix domain-containing protein n=1 Tax=Crossiella sp. SN42 TaxID=2944808 RepID=UPI0035ABC278